MRASELVEVGSQLEALLSRWSEEKARYQSVTALVRADRLIEAFLIDLSTLARSDDVKMLTLTRAAELSGYSRQHLSRLMKEGKLRNYGRARAPRVRPNELPRKPGHLPETTDPEHVSLTSRGQVVRSVLGRSSE